ncbi:glycosyltransferase family 2 protein [Halieaceae bacterium IMCC14734]|uniref:Glycosyltransferase family 2 protein n=1 Tax=Candidatus Litorirhabdus singularis TaxID=2518993 RepID=A0ABT3TF00_9GAMM|nr:glycosyltransferase family 2 protein [Candidatus Litorirhabdus singularis]MCX2980584.1 glycosyltransferase family 2 protein [Candidatus Litorirhabdus singularis]
MTDTFTYIILLNWNGWRDTIACLESIFESTDSSFRVIVCDNNSSDDSLSKIAAWARNQISAEPPEDPRLQQLVGGATRPIAHINLTATGIRAEPGSDTAAPLILIDNEDNGGFAAGNNVGIRYALNQPDMSHVWLLNNDTLVEPACLSNMQHRLQRETTPKVCGSVIHFFDNPQTIQAIGGNRFNSRTGVALESEGRFRSEGELNDCNLIEERIDYISGCSMLIPRDLLQKVGLLSEDYFLYYEEIDWFTRAGPSNRPCIASDAHIYHREGGSIGSPSWQQSTPSLLADFHIFRSKHLFMKKHHRGSMLWCYLHSCVEIGKRLMRGQFSNARVVLSVLFGASSFRA